MTQVMQLPANRAAQKALSALKIRKLKNQIPALTLLRWALRDGLVETPEWAEPEVLAALDLAEEEDREGQAVVLALETLAQEQVKGKGPEMLAKVVLGSLTANLSENEEGFGTNIM